MIDVVVLVAAGLVADAAALEAEAFAAIDQQRWCDAARLFIAANDEAPQAETLANASLALALGGARADALVQLERALPTAMPHKRADYAKRREQLLRDVAALGPGASCPASTSPPPPTPPPSTPPASTPPASTPPAPPTAEPSLLPWAGVAGGVGAAALGGVAIVVGSLPYLSYVEHNTALAAADPNDISDADRAHAVARDDAKLAYEGYGIPVVVAGAVVVGVGVVVAAGSAVWAVVE